MMQGKGYDTACIGKWHLGWDWKAIRKKEATSGETKQEWGAKTKYWKHDQFDWSQPIPDGPLAHGFDYYFGDTVINFPPYCWIKNDRVMSVPDATFTPGQHKAKTKEGNWEARPARP